MQFLHLVFGQSHKVTLKVQAQSKVESERGKAAGTYKSLGLPRPGDSPTDSPAVSALSNPSRVGDLVWPPRPVQQVLYYDNYVNLTITQ